VSLFILGAVGFIMALFEFDLTIIALTFITILISVYLMKESRNNRKSIKMDIKEEVPEEKSNSSLKSTIDIQSPGPPITLNTKASSRCNMEDELLKVDDKNDKPEENNEKTYKTYTFKVTGISKKNDKGESIQQNIKQLVKDYIDDGGIRYDGLSNKEILDNNYDAYEVYIYGFNEISLVPEVDNQYDSNAIKVIHSEIGHIGYVPKESNKKVKELLDNNCSINWELIGGKIKYVDWDEYKVKTKTLTYGVKIELIY
jgi:hypothetical protein